MFLSHAYFEKTMKLLPIDFSKPWWQVITQQKGLFISITVITMVGQCFWAISPILIAHVFESGPRFLILLLGCWVAVYCALAYAMQLNTRFQLSCIHSIHQNAHQYLLKVDPMYHVHRSSGALLGKIDRAARGCEELLDQITFEFSPLIIGLVAMGVMLSRYSSLLAIIVVCSFMVMVVGGYYFARKSCNVWEKQFIVTDDEYRTIAVENLVQVQLVRATFASDFVGTKLTHSINKNMFSESTLWLSYINATFILNLLYFATIAFLLGVLYWQVSEGLVSVVSAIGLALAYITSTKELVKIIKPFRRYMRGLTAITDLFESIDHFGKQNIPVLGPVNDTLIQKSDTIILDAKSISFDYKIAQLFNDHSLHIQAKISNAHKLYGIIGPSGSGKTTLLSILGGQLKPVAGTVIINDVDIYAINDATRRTIIALQGQTATNVKGTVRYNLLFGLPEYHTYSDDYLITMLKRVGLYVVLKNGLDTMLGEGGLNLSGGQRQRLNFAGLYLRAQFYKPVLILIDEPTSSLDELSEAAITAMINELAQTAITLVIAHRLATLDNAVGLIDLSLLHREKNITTYTPDELYKQSEYYRELAQKKIHLDG